DSACGHDSSISFFFLMRRVPPISRLFPYTTLFRSEAGIGENDCVAIYSDNSAEWITMDLAVLSIGAITVPVYSTNNKEQAAYILDRKSTRLNSSHVKISYAVFCLKKKKAIYIHMLH